MAKGLRRNGSKVEVICMDVFGAKQLIDSPDVTFALFREGLADIIATYFIGGYHDPILLVLQKAMNEGLLTLPQAIHMATNAPTMSVPGVAPKVGLIQTGRVADITIVDRVRPLKGKVCHDWWKDNRRPWTHCSRCVWAFE